jgi:hypothetical protein
MAVPFKQVSCITVCEINVRVCMEYIHLLRNHDSFLSEIASVFFWLSPYRCPSKLSWKSNAVLKCQKVTDYRSRTFVRAQHTARYHDPENTTLTFTFNKVLLYQNHNR